MAVAGDDIGQDNHHDPDGPGHDRRTCGFSHLTRRQLDVLGAIAEHHTVQGSAQALGVSPNTVKTHLWQTKKLFGVSKNSELVLAATARRILDSTVTPAKLTGKTCLKPDALGTGE